MNNWIIKIHTLPAESGDCFVIEFDNDECILIDCGYDTTYKNYLKTLLISLNNMGKRITLFIITHIDKDHIGGAINLLRENGDYNNQSIIHIDRIWFNGFKSLIFESGYSDKINDWQKQQMKIIEARNQFSYSDEDGIVSISARDCKNFELLCAKLGYPLNIDFENSIVTKQKNIWLNNIKIDIISPTIDLQSKLAKYLEKELYKLFGNEYEICNNEGFIEFYNQIMMNIDDVDDTVIEPISHVHREGQGRTCKISVDVIQLFPTSDIK